VISLFSHRSGYSFQITLPDYAAREIIEWFETMSCNNRLTEELTALVYDKLKSGELKRLETQARARNELKIETRPATSKHEQDLFENLYNWQESNSVLHREERKKEKKQMLSV